MEKKRPNLVYVFADQLRWASLGYNGDALARTPHIDALAAESADMVNAVSGHPVCAPYRASLLTGKYTTSTGMVINEIRMNTRHRCFAHVLNDAGYDTSYIGKWHLYAAQLGHHFDTKNSFVPPGPDRLGFDGYFAAYNFHHRYYAPYAYYHLDTPEKIYAEGYEPDFMTDLALARMKEAAAGDRPFALFLSLGTPHDPWTADNVPREYLDMFADTDFPLPPNYRADNDPHADLWARFFPFERRRLKEWMRVYYAMVANLDYNVGRLRAALDGLGIAEDTVFVFTSDHGEMFGAHGRRAKNIFYDEAVRVPFLLRWGDRIAPGKRDFCFNTPDIMPTLLSLMGLECPAEAEGSDLSACIKGEADSDGPSLLMGTGPTAVFGSGREWRGVRDKRFTYAVYRKDRKEYLFDNVEDPFQMNNLAQEPKFKGEKERLKAAMYAKMRSLGDDFRDNLRYMGTWVKHRRIVKTATLK